jgi:hypothetical protein
VKKIVSMSFVSLCALAAISSLSDVSYADTPACQGFQMHVGLNPSCFFTEGCGVLMQCAPGLLYWEVADFNTAAGNHTPKVTGLRPNGTTFSCTACSRTKEGNIFGCTGSVPLNVVDTSSQFTVGTVNVPTAGGLYVFCGMSAGAWYMSVAF